MMIGFLRPKRWARCRFLFVVLGICFGSSVGVSDSVAEKAKALKVSLEAPSELTGYRKQKEEIQAERQKQVDVHKRLKSDIKTKRESIDKQLKLLEKELEGTLGQKEKQLLEIYVKELQTHGELLNHQEILLEDYLLVLDKCLEVIDKLLALVSDDENLQEKSTYSFSELLLIQNQYELSQASRQSLKEEEGILSDERARVEIDLRNLDGAQKTQERELLSLVSEKEDETILKLRDRVVEESRGRFAANRAILDLKAKVFDKRVVLIQLKLREHEILRERSLEASRSRVPGLGINYGEIEEQKRQSEEKLRVARRESKRLNQRKTRLEIRAQKSQKEQELLAGKLRKAAGIEKELRAAEYRLAVSKTELETHLKNEVSDQIDLINVEAKSAQLKFDILEALYKAKRASQSRDIRDLGRKIEQWKQVVGERTALLSVQLRHLKNVRADVASRIDVLNKDLESGASRKVSLGKRYRKKLSRLIHNEHAVLKQIAQVVGRRIDLVGQVGSLFESDVQKIRLCESILNRYEQSVSTVSLHLKNFFLTLILLILAILLWRLIRQGLLYQFNENRKWASRLKMNQSQLTIIRTVLLLIVAVSLIGGLFLSQLYLWQDRYALQDFGNLLKRPIYVVDGSEISLISFGYFVVVLLLTYVCALLLSRLLKVRVAPFLAGKRGIEKMLVRLTRYGIMVVGFVIALQVLGVGFGSLVVVFGALGIGIGFGLQHIVANFVAGIVILVERTIAEGDYVTIGDDWGRVDQIRLRFTRIILRANMPMLIPNSELINGKVINWTHNDRRIGMLVQVQVAYGTDTNQVRRILLDVCDKHPKVLRYPEPEVFLNEFGADGLNFGLFYQIVDIVDRFTIQSDLHFAIDQTFREKGITIPFPQRDVHVYSRPKGEKKRSFLGS